jgi:hypothetical protein
VLKIILSCIFILTRRQLEKKIDIFRHLYALACDIGGFPYKSHDELNKVWSKERRRDNRSKEGKRIQQDDHDNRALTIKFVDVSKNINVSSDIVAIDMDISDCSIEDHCIEENHTVEYCDEEICTEELSIPSNVDLSNVLLMAQPNPSISKSSTATAPPTDIQNSSENLLHPFASFTTHFGDVLQTQNGPEVWANDLSTALIALVKMFKAWKVDTFV